LVTQKNNAWKPIKTSQLISSDYNSTKLTENFSAGMYSRYEIIELGISYGEMS